MSHVQNTPVVAVRDFSMKFGKKTIINSLTFDVKQGEIFGFLGSNGSGKTTTLRALLGLYEPTSGTLHINGKKFSPTSDNGTLGYLPEERGLYKKEPVLDIMTYFARLKGMSRSRAKKWSVDYLERVHLSSKAKTRLDKLSGGQQQKIQLGITIMGEPDLMILDEPTKGFDPLNRQLMMDIIHKENARGASIMLVSHQMEEVEKLCNRALLLHNGTAKAYGTIDEIKKSYGDTHIAIRFSGSLPRSSLYTVAKRSTGYAELRPKNIDDIQKILLQLASDTNTRITSFSAERPSLDEIFVDIYNKEAPNA